MPSTFRDPPPRGLERRAGVVVHHARVHGVRPCPQSTGKASGPGMRSKALFAPRPALAKRAARGTRNKRRPVSKNRKVGTVDRDPRTARRYAPNERRRPRDARLQRETASLRVGARLSAAARAGNAACASRRRLKGGWSREENASGAITPSTDWQVPSHFQKFSTSSLHYNFVVRSAPVISSVLNFGKMHDRRPDETRRQGA